MCNLSNAHHLTTRRPHSCSHFTALHGLSKPPSNESFLLQATLKSQNTTIMLHQLYPQATPEQKPASWKENVSPESIWWRRNTFREHMRCFGVLHPLGRVSDGCGQHGDEFGWRWRVQQKKCPIETVPFLNIYTAFLVYLAASPEEQELQLSAFTLQTLFLF